MFITFPCKNCNMTYQKLQILELLKERKVLPKDIKIKNFIKMKDTPLKIGIIDFYFDAIFWRIVNQSSTSYIGFIFDYFTKNESFLSDMWSLDVNFYMTLYNQCPFLFEQHTRLFEVVCCNTMSQILTLNEDIHNTLMNIDIDNRNNDRNNGNNQALDFQWMLIEGIENAPSEIVEKMQLLCRCDNLNLYTQNKPNDVLKSYIVSNKLKFNESSIPKIIRFLNKMNDELKKKFSFNQVTNAIEICSRLNNITDKSI